jgi:hypothetical protein
MRISLFEICTLRCGKILEYCLYIKNREKAMPIKGGELSADSCQPVLIFIDSSASDKKSNHCKERHNILYAF